MQYKYKNSKSKILNIEKVKGSIFIYRNKKDLISQRGIILTSLEALNDNSNNITHFTPNIYKYGTYVDDKRKITSGHFEKNLRQINTFYLDFDSKEINETGILSISYELGFMPTLIVKSDRGYQVFYILKEPVYITKHSDYKVIEVAKKISTNLRKYFFDEKMPIDMFCNHFGIAIFPTKDNIVYYDKNNTYSFSNWLDWSIREDDKLPTNNHFYIIKGNKGINQVDEQWFKLLLNSRKIKGSKDLIGRNNVIFTLALACYSSGVTQDECEEKLSIFNNNLEEHLKESEYKRIISSAYSNKYTAASREYIIMLCKNWINKDITSKDLFSNQIWTKFKKKRIERIRSHFSEWEEDIIKYIDKLDDIYLEIKKKDIVDSLKIPKRSLDIALKNLKKKNIIFYKATYGRSGGIRIGLLKKIYLKSISTMRNKKHTFINNLSKYFDLKFNTVIKCINSYKDNNYTIKNKLFELDVGEVLII